MDLTTLRLGLFANGYVPLPITAPDYPQHPKVKCAGKQPFFGGWQKISSDTLTPEIVEGWTTGIAHHSNTGLLTGTLLALDIDVPNEDLSAQIQAIAGAMLGATPLLRVGRAPKVALLYRNETPLSKVETPELFLPDGTKVQVEALGTGQQLVGFGIHPDTGKSYTWPNGTPTQTPLADLPVVAESKLRRFVAAAEAVLRAAGGLTKKEREEASAPQPSYRTGSTRLPPASASGSSPFFREVNTRALANIDAWFPAIFPKARQEPGTGAWRVSSADLGRDLDEDISVHPDGARDFGTEEKVSPIDLVMTWGGAPNAKDAAFYLCDRLKIAPADCGWKGTRRGNRPVVGREQPLNDAGSGEQHRAPGDDRAADAEPNAPVEARTPDLDAEPSSNPDAEVKDEPENEPDVQTDAEPKAEPEKGQAEVSPEERAEEIERLSRLLPVEYAAQRKPAAHALNITMTALDQATKAEKIKRREAAAQEYGAQPPPGPGQHRWPYGFFMRQDGLYADAGEEGEIRLSAPFSVLGEARDSGGESWSVWLKWLDGDGKAHTWPMPKRMLVSPPGTMEDELLNRGLRINVEPRARALLRQALGDVQSGDRVTLVSQAGWHAPAGGNAAYVLPNGETVGKAREMLVLKGQAETAGHAMTRAGTLKEWQDEVAVLVVGNPVPAFMMCAAFAGPLLDSLSEPSGGFHFFGRSKAGKTLALRMAISVWGLPRKGGLLRDWRSTANGLEAAAEECSDGLLPLDEIHQADPREVIGAIYSLANESGKARLRRDATAQRRRTWRSIVTSTGEIDIAAVAAKAGQTLPAGADVRLPSVSIDGDVMWPALHGAASAVDLMARLQAALPRRFGQPIRPFLERLATHLAGGNDEMERTATSMRDRFAARLPAGSDAQVRDVARRCALVALAGETATGWGILPWSKGEATRAAEKVLDLWLNRRGGGGSSEESQHVRVVRTFLLEHGASRFAVLSWEGNPGKWIEKHPDRLVLNRAGWRREQGVEETDEEAAKTMERERARKVAHRAKHGVDPPPASPAEEFLISSDAWAKMCTGGGVDPTETAKTLAEAGFLALGEGGRFSKKMRVPNVGTPRCYVVSPAIFAGRDGAGVRHGDD